MNVLFYRLRWIVAARSSAAAIAFTLASRVGVLGLNVATGIMIARTLGPAGRGAAAAVALWPVVLCGMLTLGIPVALRYYIRRNPRDAEEYFSIGLLLSALLGAIATVVGLLVLPYWLRHYPVSVVRYAQAMMFFAPLISINTLLQAYLEARGWFARSSSMVSLPTAGTLLCLLGLFAFHALDPLTVPLAYEIPFSIATIAMLYRLRRSIRKPWDLVRRGRVLLHFGARAYGIDLINTLSAQIGQVIVIGSLSAGSFGLFAVAINASRLLGVVGSSLDTVLFPKASELDREDAIALVLRLARVIFAANVIAGALLIAAMPFLVRLAYGVKYAAVTPVAQVLTAEIIVGATVGTLSQAFMATGRPGLVTVFQTVGLCTSFPLLLVLVPRYGLLGAAYAIFLSTAVRLIFVLIAYPLFLRHRVPRLLLTAQDVLDIRARLTRAMT